MIYQLNITAYKFDFIDFSESSAFFNLMPQLGSQVELQTWGITLLTSEYRRNPLKLQGIKTADPSSNIYIAGPAKVTFSNVVGGELKIALYDPDHPDSFLVKSDNTPVTLQRRWEFDPNAESVFVYELDCSSDWPPGACYLAIATTGPALLTFEESDCIPARQFVLNPQKYSQPGWKQEDSRKLSPRLETKLDTEIEFA
jgi:hypothetical protein